jgi:cytochrome c
MQERIVNPNSVRTGAALRTGINLLRRLRTSNPGKLAHWFVAVVALAAGLPALPAHADEKLARARNCYACHQVDGKLVGPAWRDVAARYARDPEAEARLARKIREGGAGAWGVVAMAPNPAVTDADARALARWVLALRPGK